MINEAVILLGGMGTRLLPYTKTVSKEMLPIYNVPAIFLLVKEAYLIWNSMSSSLGHFKKQQECQIVRTKGQTSMTEPSNVCAQRPT